jgi:hypothetical protein
MIPSVKQLLSIKYFTTRKAMKTMFKNVAIGVFGRILANTTTFTLFAYSVDPSKDIRA